MQACMQDVFDTYDENQSGKLEREQLAAVLTDVSAGRAPEPHEIDWVFAHADVIESDGINKTELMHALTLWIKLQQLSPEALSDGSENENAPRRKSCCVM